MTFSPTFGRTFSPTFKPNSLALAGGAWWNFFGAQSGCYAAYQAKGVANIAASYVNLAIPGTNDLTTAYAPAFDTSYGWLFPSVIQARYLDTGLVFGTTHTLLCRFASVTVANGIALFGVDAAADCFLYTVTGGNWWIRYGSVVDSGTTGTSGVFAIAGGKLYLNGNLIATATPATLALSMTAGGGVHTAASTWTASLVHTIQAFVMYDTVLAGTRVAEISNAMAAL